MVADSHGWNIDRPLNIHVPNFAAESSNPDRDYTIFEPGEVELNEMMKSLYDRSLNASNWARSSTRSQ